MHPVRRFATLVAFVALTLTGSLTASHHVLADQIVGHVYVNANTSPVNSIAAFDRHADGSLTPMAGSPFAASGTGGTLPSQGAVQLSGDGRYLLAVDTGSNQISVLRVGDDGSLRPVSGSPFWSGGVAPTTIAVHGPIVVVGNDGNSTGGADYAAFFLLPGGRLVPIPGAVYTLPSPTTIGDVLFSPDGRHFIGTRVNSSLIDSFTIGLFGRVRQAPGSPFPAQGYGPFGSKFRPTDPDQLYVSNAHNAASGPAPGTVSAFDVANDGTFSSIGASPYPSNQTAACWIEISHDGQHLYAVNTGSNSVSAFLIAPDGSLNFISYTTLTGTVANLGALDAGISPDDTSLYVVERGAKAVAALHVNGDGSLTELPGSPAALPANSVAFGIAVN